MVLSNTRSKNVRLVVLLGGVPMALQVNGLMRVREASQPFFCAEGPFSQFLRLRNQS